MGIRVDFTNVEPQAEPGSGPLPEGTYQVVVDEAKERTSQRGTQGISLKLRVTGGEFDGRTLYDDLWLTQAALGYVLHRLHCLGVQPPKGGFVIDPGNLVNRRGRVVVRHQPDQDGQTRARVKGWEPPAAADDPFRQAAATAGPAHRDPASGDDDIPF